VLSDLHSVSVMEPMGRPVAVRSFVALSHAKPIRAEAAEPAGAARSGAGPPVRCSA
jgi:hypothetical protein